MLISFKYDSEFRLQAQLSLPLEMREGWGLTRCADNQFYASDGRDRLFKIELKETAVVRGVERVTTADGISLYFLSDLECVENRIFAVIYPTNRIAVIRRGIATLIDFEYLYRIADALNRRAGGGGLRSEDSLRGIASDGKGDFFLTGLNWPTIFRVRLPL